MTRYCFLFVAVLAGFINKARAQTDGVVQKGVNPLVSIGFSPLNIVNNTVRFEMETSFNKKNPVFVAVAPIFYSGSTSLYTGSRHLPPNDGEKLRDMDIVSGGGAEAFIKVSRCMDPVNYKFLYFGFGVGYHKINLDFRDYDWEPYMEDGLEYHRYNYGKRYERIRRMDVFGMFGARFYVDNLLFFDLQMGLAYRNPTITSNMYAPRERPQHFFDHGYEGFAYRFNATIGISIFGKEQSSRISTDKINL